ncbi:MAG: helicase associated domain-containing protein [Microbacterium sp.]
MSTAGASTLRAQRGATVLHDETAEMLYRQALEAWERSEDEDRAQSRAYAEAEATALLLATGPVARRPARWADALHRYEMFWTTSGARPRENTRDRATIPAGERHLGEWARYQRRFFRALARYQRIRLHLSPAFSWDPHEDSWLEQLAQCQRFLMRTGGLPRLNGSDADEFKLARWLGRQLAASRQGLLEPKRAAHLAALFQDSNARPQR